MHAHTPDKAGDLHEPEGCQLHGSAPGQEALNNGDGSKRAARYAQQKAWRDTQKPKLREKRIAKYQANREQERAYQRQYYAENADRLRANARARNAAKKDELRVYKKEWIAGDRARDRAKYLWRSAKIRAARRRLAFTLRLEDIVIPTTCPVLHIPIVIESGTSLQPGAPSLDRIDNAQGYTRSNVRVISHRANALKRDASLEELRLIIENWNAR